MFSLCVVDCESGWGIVNINLTNLTVMLYRVCFCEKVGEVHGSWLPLYAKVSLFHAVADPVKAHVDGLGVFLFHSVERETDGALVVAGDERGWLGITELGERDAERLGFRCDGEECSVFSFCGRSDNDVENGAKLLHRCVDELGIVVLAEKEKAADARA